MMKYVCYVCCVCSSESSGLKKLQHHYLFKASPTGVKAFWSVDLLPLNVKFQTEIQNTQH